MDTVNLVARNNQDFQYSRNVAGWLLLYPNANFRMQMRATVTSPVVTFQWLKTGANSFAGTIAVAADLMVISAPVDAVAGFVGVYFYDCRLEDAASGASVVIFGGTLTFDDGVTLSGAAV